jgi:hypothetical protein
VSQILHASADEQGPACGNASGRRRRQAVAARVRSEKQHKRATWMSVTIYHKGVSPISAATIWAIDGDYLPG